MSEKKSIGDMPAFPIIATEHHGTYAGMSYRQWLIGIIAAGLPNLDEDTAAEFSIDQADAVIKRLDGEGR